MAPEDERLLSMTEDELRSYAQAVTDTDLYYKSPGKKIISDIFY